MAIDNAQVTKFCNERVRVFAEQMVGMQALLNNHLAQWYGTVSALVPNTSETITDGRANEGISVLTGADVNNVVARMASVADVLNAANAMDVLVKAAVRGINVSMPGS